MDAIPNPITPQTGNPRLPQQPAAPLSSGNPFIDEIDNAHASLSHGAKQAIDQAHGIVGLKPTDTGAAAEQAAAPAWVPNGIQSPSMGGMAPMAAGAPTSTDTSMVPSGIRSPLSPALSLGGTAGQSDNQAKLGRLQTTGSGISQIHNPWARVPLQILDAIGGGLVPGIEQRIPGTEGHHQVQLNQQQAAVTGDEQQRAAADKSALEQAQALNQEAQPELKRTAEQLAESRAAEVGTHNRAQEDIARAKDLSTREIAAGKTQSVADIAAEKNRSTLAQHGFKQDEKGAIVPLEYTEMSEPQQAVHDLKAAQSEREKATADLRKAQAENQPTLIKLAQQRLASAQEAHSIAIRRLGLSEEQTEARLHGTQGGVALPGATQTDTGETVGTAFQRNVLPTTGEINKGDLARSAVDRVAEMRDILKRRPDLFGPGNGRISSLQMAIGNQDPEAQKFLAASKYLADHSAALFGGRSEYISKSLEGLNAQKINTAALLAALDEAEKTAKPFADVGTRHTVGGKNEIKSGGGHPPTVKSQAEFDALAPGTVFMEDGKKYTKPGGKK